MKRRAQFDVSTKVGEYSVAVSMFAVTDHMTKKKIKDQLQDFRSSEVCTPLFVPCSMHAIMCVCSAFQQ